MNDTRSDQPTKTRRATDAALILIAVAAFAGFVWRRFLKPGSPEKVAKVGEPAPPSATTNGNTS